MTVIIIISLGNHRKIEKNAPHMLPEPSIFYLVQMMMLDNTSAV